MYSITPVWYATNLISSKTLCRRTTLQQVGTLQRANTQQMELNSMDPLHPAQRKCKKLVTFQVHVALETLYQLLYSYQQTPIIPNTAFITTYSYSQMFLVLRFMPYTWYLLVIRNDLPKRNVFRLMSDKNVLALSSAPALENELPLKTGDKTFLLSSK